MRVARPRVNVPPVKEDLEVLDRTAKEVREQAKVATTVERAWEVARGAVLPSADLSKAERKVVEQLHELQAHAEPITEARLERLGGIAGKLRQASDSYRAMVGLLHSMGSPTSAGPGLPLNASVGHRVALIAQVDAVEAALAAAGDLPELRSISVPQLHALKHELQAGLEQLPPAAAQRALEVGALVSADDSARALGAALQSPDFGPERIARVRGALPPEAREALDAHLRSAALLVDQALNAPDYRNSGMGYQNPKSLIEYQRHLVDATIVARSEARVEASFDRFSEGLEAALRDPYPDVALGRWVTGEFVREIGARPAADWKISPQAVAKALAANALLPLRALNETVDVMAPKAPSARPQLKDAVADVTRHVLEGDLRAWRYGNPASVAQLGMLTAVQRAGWVESPTTEHPTARGHVLKVREEDDLGLLWLTKIGGPSHGFDVGGHCLLPALCNGRTKALVIDDPRWPNAAARAYLRVLPVEGQPPQLYLEPLEIDFPHRAQFTSPEEQRDFQQALIEHAVAKARQLGMKLSLSPDLAHFAESMGLRGGARQHAYVLEPSAGVFEASDTLTPKHDWVQTGREVTAGLWRMVIDADRARP